MTMYEIVDRHLNRTRCYPNICDAVNAFALRCAYYGYEFDGYAVHYTLQQKKSFAVGYLTINPIHCHEKRRSNG